MKTATKEKRNGVQWSMLTQLDDLDFADDLALLSHSHRQIKTTELALISAQVGLKINKRKTKILRTNTTCETPINRDYFVWKSVKFYIKLQYNVYVDTLWNTPACRVIIICLTAKSKQCLERNISWKPVVVLQYPWQTPSLARGGSSTTVPLADTLASQGWL